MPRHFRDAGVSFDYPGNWEITENKALPSGRLIFLEEPGSAIVILTIYGPAFDVVLEEYVDEFRQSIGSSVPFSLLRHTSFEAKAAGLDCKYSIQLAGIDVPHTANFTKHVLGENKVVCLTQVADEDRHLVDVGFELIRRTLSTIDPEKPGRASGSN